MRLLLINPNTTAAITDRVADQARGIVGEGVEIRAVTGRFGARYIASRAAAAVAAHCALDCLAEHAEGCDAVLLACFGDPGLDALKEVSRVPVVGMAEASARQASRLGRRFSIVTGGERWEAMLTEFVDGMGLSTRLASVRTVAPTGGAIAADPEGSIQLLADAVVACGREDGADVVILGGSGLVGLAARVGEVAGMPVICSLEAGLKGAMAAAASVANGPGPLPVEMLDVSPALTRMFAGQGRPAEP